MVAFSITPVITFNEFRDLVGQYWGLNPHDVFFSVEPSDRHGKIFLGD
jgi:hypothetical protein